MKKLTKQQIISMQQAMLQSFGGMTGIRSEELLESALNAPFQTFDGKFIFSTIQQKAVRLGYGLIVNHPFIDGNKRIGVHAMLMFLSMNGIELEFTQRELYETILNVAAGAISYEALLQWVLEHEK